MVSVHRINVYEIIDNETKHVLVTKLSETKAKAICEKLNTSSKRVIYKPKCVKD